MKVILKEDVPKVGNKFEVVNVSDGYARNFLIPRGLAVAATPGALKEIEKWKKLAQRKEEKLRQEADAWAKRLESVVVDVKVQVGEEGRMFTHVGTREIAEAIRRQLALEIDHREIDLDEPIKTLGVHVVPVRVHRKVMVEVRVNVTGETVS